MTSALPCSASKDAVRRGGVLVLVLAALACSPPLAEASSVSAITAAGAGGTPTLVPSNPNQCEPRPPAGVASGPIPQLDTNPCPAVAPILKPASASLPFTGLTVAALAALGAVLLSAGAAVRWLGWRRGRSGQ